MSTRLSLIGLIVFGPVCFAAEPSRMAEEFPAGTSYRIQLNVEIDGRMTVPLAPEKTQILTVSGKSHLLYDERVLKPDDATLDKVLRHYRKVEFHRMLGSREQKAGIREAVRRMVVLRSNKGKSPFSPDGPLTWNEIDVVKSDIFAPALIPALLPPRAVSIGDEWPMGPSGIVELTDMEKADEGRFTIKFVSINPVKDHRHARLSISGNIKGVDENGPCRHTLEGTLFFDLDSQRFVYLSLRGTHELLDAQGNVNGRINGRFVMERLETPSGDALNVDKVETRPTLENSMLLHENSELGVRFLYPRRWRVGATQGNQVTLDGPNGSGLLLTLEPSGKVPTAQVYLREIEQFLQKEKSPVRNRSEIERVQEKPLLERFGLDAELSREKLRMEYAVLQQLEGGATVAARLPLADAAILAKDVDAICRSLRLTKTIR